MATTILNDRITAVASYRATLVDSWTEDLNLIVGSLEQELPPAISNASLSRRYGFIVNTELATREAVTCLDLRNKYIKIVLTQADTTVTWYGIIVNQIDSIFANVINPDDGVTEIPTGTTSYECYGIEYLLKKELITGSYVELEDSSISYLQRPLVFNDEIETEEGNRTSLMPTGYNSYIFGGSELWSALEVVQYLLELFDRKTGFPFSLSGDYVYLSQFTKVWDFRQDTFWNALNELINPASGFIMIVSGQNIEVRSITDTDVIFDSAVILPANEYTATLDLTDSSKIEDVTIKTMENYHYDKVRVYSDYLMVTMSFSVAQGTLEKAWTAQDEYDFLQLAVDEEKDLTDYEHVYTQFRLPDTFAGIYISGDYYVMPSCTNDAYDHTTNQTRWYRDLRLEPYLLGNKEKRLTCYVLDYDKYFNIESPRGETKKTTVRPLDNEFGFKLNPSGPQWYFADTHALTLDDTEFNYEELVAVGSFYSNERYFIQVDCDTQTNSEVEKVKEIFMSDILISFIPEKTVRGVNSSGALIYQAYDLLEGDTATLRKMAELAKVFYGKPRSQIDLTYASGVLMGDRLGYIVQSTNTGNTYEPTNTIITSVSYRNLDKGKQTTRVTTDFSDFDLRIFIDKDNKQSSRSATSHHGSSSARRKVTEKLVDSFSGSEVDSGGASGSMWAIITTAGTGPTGHTASIWTDGYYDGTGSVRTPDLTAQALRLPGLAAGQTPLTTIPYAVVSLAADGVYEADPGVAR